ncbi:MAG: DsbA family protein [Pseudomonadota bacterium]
MNRRDSLKMLGGTMLTGTGLMGATAWAQDSEIDTSQVVEMALGDENAPVTFIEYASFTCPHCARFHQNQFKDLKADFIDTGKVRFIHRDVYFDKYGLWASMVARCGGPERFFGITDMIYAEQRDWIGDGEDAGVAERLRKIGKVAGLTADELDACLSDRDHAQALVAAYQENSAADDVNSTPTLIIDGKKYQNMAYPELKEIIEGKLN